MKKGQMLIMTAVVIMVSLGAVFMWAEGGITKEVTIGQTQSDIFNTFALGQTINNYLTDSAEIAKCNSMKLTSDAAEEENLVIDEATLTAQEYFEQMFIHHYLVYMADFPKIKKTSLQDDFSLYENLFFEIEFDYESGVINGAPARVKYENDEFIDYLEIVGENGFSYTIQPVFTIEMDGTFFESPVTPESCKPLAVTETEEESEEEEETTEESTEETAYDVETTTT